MKFPFLLMINQQAEIDIHLSYHNMLRNSKFTTYSYQDTILTSMWQHRNNCPIYTLTRSETGSSAARCRSISARSVATEDSEKVSVPPILRCSFSNGLPTSTHFISSSLVTPATTIQVRKNSLNESNRLNHGGREEAPLPSHPLCNES